MNAYVCVYRQPVVDKLWQRTWDEADGIPKLKKYLRRYERRFRKNKKGIGRFYDWGDDPSFFATEEFLGDVRKAGWGVCRRDVRDKLNRGDFIIFFCAQQQEDDEDLWKYYYIGLGTVGHVIQNRERIWRTKKYKDYRKFYNLLIDSEGRQYEMIHRFHQDWKRRAKSPYVVFDDSPLMTHFNLCNPLLVARYWVGDSAWKGNIMETWRLSNAIVREVYDLIPQRNGGKKLRTSYTGFGHSLMNLSNELDHDVKRLKRTRKSLLKISREIADL